MTFNHKEKAILQMAVATRIDRVIKMIQITEDLYSIDEHKKYIKELSDLTDLKKKLR